MAQAAQESRTASQDNSKKWAQVVAHAWADDSFKKRLTANPAAVLQEHGIIVPAGVEIRVVEETGNVRYLTLPPKPDVNVSELSPEQLESISGGYYRITNIRASAGGFSPTGTTTTSG